jgi:hypothetical protein
MGAIRPPGWDLHMPSCKKRNHDGSFRTCEEAGLVAYENGLSGILSQNFNGPVGNDRAFFLGTFTGWTGVNVLSAARLQPAASPP